MIRSVWFISCCTFVLVALSPLYAQEVVLPGPGDEVSKVELKALEIALANMERDADIEDAAKDLLRPKYQEAVEAGREAEYNAAKAASYREAIVSGAVEAARLKEQLAKLPPVEKVVVALPNGGTAELQRELESRTVTLAGMKEDLAEVEGELVRLRGRPGQISIRMPEAQRELAEVVRKLNSTQFSDDQASPGRVADRMLFGALRVRLQAELDMLEQEELSQPLRENWLRGRRDLLTRQVKIGAAELDAIKTARNQRLTGEAKRVVNEAGAALKNTVGGDTEVRILATEVEILAKEFKEVVAALKATSAEHADLASRLGALTREEQVIREQLKLGRVGGVMARRLFDLRQALPGRRGLELQLKARRAMLGERRLAALDVDQKIMEQTAVERKFADRSDDTLTKMLASRREVLGKLDAQYGTLNRALGALATEEARYLDKVGSVAVFLEEELFWVKSSPPVGIRTVTDIPEDVRALFGWKAWQESGEALLGAGPVDRARGGVVVLVVVGLLLGRRRLRRILKETATQVRRISTDCYKHTSMALLATLILALPIPLLVGYVSWMLRQAPDPSALLRAAGRALWWASVLGLATGFLSVACRRGGLAIAHFGWHEESTGRLRRLIHWFAAVYIPALVLVRLSFLGDKMDHFDSLGRTCFLVSHIVLAVLLWRSFRFKDGILAQRSLDYPNSLMVRFRHVWFPLIILCPLVLVVLACFGYLFTALLLSLELILTAGIIAGGVILYWLTLRWFMIRERKLALVNAIEERRARQEAAVVAAAGEEESPRAGEVVMVEIEEEIDLPSIGEQTRQLLEFLFVVGVVIAVGLLWSETNPLFSGLDKVRTGRGFSLLNLGQAVLIIVGIMMAYRNLPGLLELTLSGKKPIERGTRVAIVTLCQYGLIAVGLGLLFQILHVDWAKFGWIAAALSVGLGFGLQEVVANFVCGLIILFERPVRVGDVVTVGGTTGSVTRIRMRATTIINWDRQEYVVPNKELVTTAILNWTLSNSVNRVVIEVGVAYGTDTRKARGILLDVATDHSVVLEDPAPIATFEGFADSNLTLRLRVYLPDMDNRLRTITELHAEIDRRFAEIGIEIAFPQRDLHLRGWKPGAAIKEEGSGGSAGSESSHL